MMPIEVTSQGMDLEFTVSYEFSTVIHYPLSTLNYSYADFISAYLESIMSLKTTNLVSS